MSMIDLRQYAALLDVCQSAGDAAEDCQTAALFDFTPDEASLSDAERDEVRLILSAVALRLATRSLSIQSMRRRLGAIVESLIAVLDALDGDCDLEDGADQEAVCEDEGAQCEDEGNPDDNGIADADGRAEQLPGAGPAEP